MKTFFSIFTIFFIQTILAAGPVEKLLEDISSNSEYYKTELSDKKVKQYLEGVESIINTAYELRDTKDDDFDGYYPKDLYEVYFDSAQVFFLDGYATSQNLNQWVLDYKQLMGTDLDKIFDLHANLTDEEKTELRFKFIKAEILKIHQNFINNIKSTVVGCAKEGDNVHNKKCCENHVKLPLVVDNPSSLKCQLGGNTCNNNGNCCSGVCEKTNPDKPGVCVAPMYCSRIRTVNEACSDQHSICKDSSCIDYDKLNSGSLSCKVSGKSCSNSNECCSTSCQSGKCQPKTLCMSCKSVGAKVGKDESCCPGTIKLNGKCTLPMPKFVPTVNYSKSLFNKVVNVLMNQILISSAQADTDNTIGDGASSVSGVSARNEEQAETSQEQVETSSEESAEDFIGLTSKQKIVLNQMSLNCRNKMKDNLTECLKKVNEKEREFLAANNDDGTSSVETSELNIDAKTEYMNSYEIPGITSKTYSNLKQCSFNTFNDSWKDASDAEKNAELFLRAYEYVFSHKGTQDYWEDSGKGSIFSRANKAAIEFRKHRAELLTKMKEIDKKMFCKCIPIYGVENFDEVKQAAFTQNCSTQAALLEVKKNRAKEESGVDTENLREIEEGGIGISHEQLLVEWLELRAESQLARFELNSNLEEDLEELSEYINTEDYIKVFKDKIMEKNLVRSSPAGDSLLLYKWGYTYRPSWMKIVSFVTFGLVSFNNARTSGLEADKAASSHAMLAAWRYEEADDIDSTPEIIDVKTMKGKCVKHVLGVCVKKADGFHRYFLGPKFTKTNTKTDSCEVNGRATACFKSAYQADFGGETNYVMDPTLPLFVDPSLISLNKMDGTSSPFPALLNRARDAGVNYLQSRKPNGGTVRGYLKTKAKFGEEPYMKDAIELGHFLPEGGKLQIRDVNKESNSGVIKHAIIKGARTYTECKNLIKDCQAQDVEDGAVGFGYLFESTEDAARFAEYVYEIHWKWSHITQNNYMGYPLQGLGQYFSLVSYNMKLVGSTAISRFMKYQEAANLYKSDLALRESDYKATATIKNGADESVRAKFESKENGIYNVLANLNLNGTTNLEVYDRAVSDAVKSGNLSSGAMNTLASARNSAVRRNKDIAEAKELESALTKSDHATQNAYAANKKALAKINSPIGSAGLSSFGASGSGVSGFSDLASLSSGSGSGSSSDKSSDKDKKAGGNGRKSPLVVDYSNQAYGDNFSGGLSSSMLGASLTSFGGDDDEQVVPKSGINYSKDSGLSRKQVSNMLNEFSKDKSLSGNDADTIFGLVSKAYKRNYGRVLSRIESSDQVNQKDDKKTSELKALLEK